MLRRLVPHIVTADKGSSMKRKPQIGEYLNYQGNQGKVVSVWMQEDEIWAGLKMHGDKVLTHAPVIKCFQDTKKSSSLG